MKFNCFSKTYVEVLRCIIEPETEGRGYNITNAKEK